MPAIHEITTYSFQELDSDAKENALNRCRDYNTSDSFWWEYIVDDFQEICAILGITLARRKGGQLCVWFSGFSSQGDGACFEGTYRYRKGWRAALQAHAPIEGSDSNLELHRLAWELHRVQASRFYGLVCEVRHRGRYNHSNCTSIEVNSDYDFYRDLGDAEEEAAQALRSLMDWLYARLEEEYNYCQSDDSVVAALEANEVEFLSDGKPYLGAR